MDGWLFSTYRIKEKAQHLLDFFDSLSTGGKPPVLSYYVISLEESPCDPCETILIACNAVKLQLDTGRKAGA